MKQKILLVVLSLFFSFAVFAQEDGERIMFFGGHGGLNISRFQTEFDSTTTGARFGWQAGGMLRYGKKFFCEAQVNLGQSSVEMIRKDTSALNIAGKVYRTYISVPIMAGYKVFSSKDGTSSLRIMGGVETTMILNAKVDENIFYVTKKDFEPTSFAAVAGVGFDLWVLKFDLAFHYGLTPMLQNDKNSKNIMGSFNIGLIF